MTTRWYLHFVTCWTVGNWMRVIEGAVPNQQGTTPHSPGTLCFALMLPSQVRLARNNRPICSSFVSTSSAQTCKVKINDGIYWREGMRHHIHVRERLLSPLKVLFLFFFHTHTDLEAIKPFHLMGMFSVDLEKTQSVKADVVTKRNKKKPLNSTPVSNNADFSDRL